MKQRYLDADVRQDLVTKMVFVAGPRQVGRTTLAKQNVAEPRAYLCWDIPAHREAILRRLLPPFDTIALDEIHKYRPWRAYLKGIYDEAGSRLRILVTGGAGTPSWGATTSTGCTRSPSRSWARPTLSRTSCAWEGSRSRSTPAPSAPHGDGPASTGRS